MTQLMARRMLEKEECLSQTEFRVVHYSQAAMSEDPEASRCTLMNRAKAKLTLEDADIRAGKAKALPKQGQLLREGSEIGGQIWTLAVSAMSSEKMKFTLNAATDTLPHNSNLALWRGLNDCVQTLSHVLNHCEVALKLCHYNHRHDAILSIIASFLSSHLLYPHTR